MTQQIRMKSILLTIYETTNNTPSVCACNVSIKCKEEEEKNENILKILAEI